MTKSGIIKMTYNNYISLQTNNTRPYLMISELIDNSISSFEIKHGEDYQNWDLDTYVQIEIKIKMNPKSSNYKRLHDDYEIKENTYIIVKDNAYGMDPETLYQSIELDNKKITKGSNKNIHGRGLKQAAFYFGMSLNIITNNGNEISELDLDMTKVEKLSEPIVREVKSVKNNFPRGTQIKIYNVYKNKTLENKKRKSHIDEIIDSIKTRYWKFIISKKLKIKLITDLGTKEKEILIDENSSKPLFIKKFTIEEFLKGKNKNKAIKEINKIIDNFDISKYSSNYLYEDNNYEKSIKKSFKEMFLKNKNFSWEILESFGGTFSEKVNLKFKFWQTGLTSNYSKWRGIYTYEGGRAINHGPIFSKDMGAYLEWFPANSHTTGSTDNRFIGEVDITNTKGIQPINDKSQLQFDKDIKDDLDKFIYFNWKLYDIIILFIRNNDSQSREDFDNKNIEKSLKERYSSYLAKENKRLISAHKIKVDKDKKLEGDFTLNDQNWKIIIISDQSNNKNNEVDIITDCKLNHKNKKLIIYYNEYANIWIKANDSSSREFYSNVLYPIIIQLAIQFINITLYNYKSPIKALNNDNDISDRIN